MKSTRHIGLSLSLLLGLALTGCGPSTPEQGASAGGEAAATTATVPAASTASAAAVDQTRYANAASEPGQWLNYGGTWKEQRYSALDQINDSNVNRLGLAWFAELGTMRGVEGTPLVIDGVLYNISAWSVTTAYNAATGEKLWQYDPKVAPEYSRITCCGTVSRGVSAWNGKIIIPALDGRLIAVDAKTGEKIWETDTKIAGQPLSITGAPRMANGMVVIGNSGGDVGARGYMSAYNADTGEKAWRFFIVPGEPGKPDGEASDSVMEMAAKTWTGEWWKMGGGGNNWDGIAYDPDLNLVYFPTGNGSPHHMKFRSPQGGDNLFLCSIVAVDATTGEYKWHYQEVPSEQWDYDCTSQPLLGEVNINGVERKVIMHAPKHAYFYVIDRATGELLSAEHYTKNSNWSSHVDLATGRPVLNSVAYPTSEPVLLSPGFGGGHTWNPMSFNPKTGLVYLPAQETYQVYAVADELNFKLGASTWAGGRGNPELRKVLNQQMQDKEEGFLLAWDPVKQQEVWRVQHPHSGSGGTMTTAGNLVLQSTIRKTLSIFSADKGELLWEMPIDSVAPGGPVTYEVDGKQYIAINAGWNSALVYGLNEGGVPFTYAPARLLVFALDATGVALPPPPEPATLVAPPATQFAREQIERGAVLFSQTCQLCHGQNAIGGLKDLRYMRPDTHAEFNTIILQGTRADKGMPRQETMTEEQVNDIHAYVISRAQEDWQGGFMQ
jgi:quinohemoprotein ethanol dehydrogenase